MNKILLELETKDKSIPYEFMNDFIDIYFYKDNNDIYLHIDGEKHSVSHLATISKDRLLREYVPILELSNKDKERLTGVYLNKGYRNTYLFMDKDSFKILLELDDIYFIIKEIPFEENSYIEFYERNSSNSVLRYFLIGNRRDSFITINVKDTSTFAFLNLYQEGLQKIHLFNNKQEDF